MCLTCCLRSCTGLQITPASGHVPSCPFRNLLPPSRQTQVIIKISFESNFAPFLQTIFISNLAQTVKMTHMAHSDKCELLCTTVYEAFRANFLFCLKNIYIKDLFLLQWCTSCSMLGNIHYIKIPLLLYSHLLL